MRVQRFKEGRGLNSVELMVMISILGILAIVFFFTFKKYLKREEEARQNPTNVIQLSITNLPAVAQPDVQEPEVFYTPDNYQDPDSD